VVLWNRVTGQRALANLDAEGRRTRAPTTQPLGVSPGSATASDSIAFSRDGRFLVFDEASVGLVPNDTNGASDVFVHDLATGATARASVSSTGAQGNGGSYFGSISDDGSLIAFLSSATNFAANDNNAQDDVFVHENELFR
jgi:Tol biopolymer transport system component